MSVCVPATDRRRIFEDRRSDLRFSLSDAVFDYALNKRCLMVGAWSKLVDGDRALPKLAVVLAEKARAEEVETPRPELPPTESGREQSRHAECARRARASISYAGGRTAEETWVIPTLPAADAYTGGGHDDELVVRLLDGATSGSPPLRAR